MACRWWNFCVDILTCFERLGECGPTDAERALECEAPCKRYFGTKGIGEECNGLSDFDDCGQGLVCQGYSYHEWDCGPGGFASCSDYEHRCVDPCQSQTDTACNAREFPSTCGVDSYCDDPWWLQDYADGTCRMRGAIGDTCDAEFDSCAGGSFCDEPAIGGPTCVATVVDGTPCTADDQCASRRCGDSLDSDVQVGVCEATLTAWCYGY